MFRNITIAGWIFIVCASLLVILAAVFTGWTFPHPRAPELLYQFLAIGLGVVFTKQSKDAVFDTEFYLATEINLLGIAIALFVFILVVPFLMGGVDTLRDLAPGLCVQNGSQFLDYILPTGSRCTINHLGERPALYLWVSSGVALAFAAWLTTYRASARDESNVRFYLVLSCALYTWYSLIAYHWTVSQPPGCPAIIVIFEGLLAIACLVAWSYMWARGLVRARLSTDGAPAVLTNVALMTFAIVIGMVVLPAPRASQTDVSAPPGSDFAGPFAPAPAPAPAVPPQPDTSPSDDAHSSPPPPVDGFPLHAPKSDDGGGRTDGSDREEEVHQ